MIRWSPATWARRTGGFASPRKKRFANAVSLFFLIPEAISVFATRLLETAGFLCLESAVKA
jgi:hypothetical protein